MKSHDHDKIRLGFTDQEFEPGAHVCQIFNNDAERHESLVNYIVTGLKGGERAACFSEAESAASLGDFFTAHGIDYYEVEHKGDFTLSKTGEVYFKDGIFDPDRMLGLLRDFYLGATDYAGARVIGEMTPDIEHVEGGKRLLEYESKVSMLQREYPVTAVCQYDARKFDGSTILDILKVHPLMIVRGKIVKNPFYITPDEYLKEL